MTQNKLLDTISPDGWKQLSSADQRKYIRADGGEGALKHPAEDSAALFYFLKEEFRTVDQ